MTSADPQEEMRPTKYKYHTAYSKQMIISARAQELAANADPLIAIDCNSGAAISIAHAKQAGIETTPFFYGAEEVLKVAELEFSLDALADADYRVLQGPAESKPVVVKDAVLLHKRTY